MRIIKANSWQPIPLAKQPKNEVATIIKNVQRHGLKALRTYAEKWDGGTPQQWLISGQQCEEAWKSLNRQDRQAIATASRQVKAWCQKCLPRKNVTLKKEGITLKQRVTPYQSVACYVPGGHYPLVSSVIMSVIPACVAGVNRRVLMTPAVKGVMHPAILAAAFYVQATEVWAIGGAQAIACAAYEIGPFKKVDKIVGPGNSFVTEAKRQVQEEVSIDMLAGPSELLVIIDASTDLKCIAYDLLAQAEHGLDSQSIVMSRSLSVLKKLENVLWKETDKFYSSKHARQIVSQIAGLHARSKCDLIETANHIASEHVQLAVKDSSLYVDALKNFGTLFIGEQTPTVLGDYTSGANHILPTLRGGRFRGGLTVEDFLIKRTIQQYSPTKKNHKLYQQAAHLAHMEGLKAHEESIKVRQEKL